MLSVTETDREILRLVEALPNALNGRRIYSMTALLALAVQRKAYEEKIRQIVASYSEQQSSATMGEPTNAVLFPKPDYAEYR